MSDVERQIASYARPPLGHVGWLWEGVAKKKGSDQTVECRLSAKVYTCVYACVYVCPTLNWDRMHGNQ